MENPQVSIIILNWNGWDDTLECLDSLLKITYTDFNVIILDNGSTDESAAKIDKFIKNKIKNCLPLLPAMNEGKMINNKAENTFFLNENKLKLIHSIENHGFAEGNNIAIRQALKLHDPEYILLLNNDTIVSKDFLYKLITVINSDSKIGIVGPKCYFFNHTDVIQSIGIKINWFKGECRLIGWKQKDKGQHDSIKYVESISGCAMLIRANIFKDNIFLDKKFFLYYEDIDFCLRVREKGYNIACVPSSTIWHKTSKSSRKTTGIKEYYSIRNLFIIMRRYSKREEFLIFMIYFFLFKVWYLIALTGLYHSDPKSVIPLIKGTIHGLKAIIEPILKL